MFYRINTFVSLTDCAYIKMKQNRLMTHLQTQTHYNTTYKRSKEISVLFVRDCWCLLLKYYVRVSLKSYYLMGES